MTARACVVVMFLGWGGSRTRSGAADRGNELPDLRAPSFGGTAACAGKDTELWFPEPGELFTEAQAICHGCAVRTECFEYTIGDPSLKGVWAGTSERARARIRAERAQRALLEPAPVAS